MSVESHGNRQPDQVLDDEDRQKELEVVAERIEELAVAEDFAVIAEPDVVCRFTETCPVVKTEPKRRDGREYHEHGIDSERRDDECQVG